MPLDALQVIEQLALEPLPGEGGYYRETYRSSEIIPPDALPPRYTPNAGRNHSTQIYFLLTVATPSLMHVVRSDEVFHHYLGDPVEQLQIDPGAGATVVRIGSDLAAGERPQAVVPRGVWQGCRVTPDHAQLGYALLGCTVSPGFDWADFRLGTRSEMRALWTAADPRIADLIEALTPAEDR